MAVYKIKTKVEEKGFFSTNAINPAKFSDAEKKQMGIDVAQKFLAEGKYTGAIKVLSNVFDGSTMITTVEVI